MWRVDVRNRSNTLTRGGVLSETDPYNALTPYEGHDKRCNHFSEKDAWVGQVVKVTPSELWVSVGYETYIVFNEKYGSLPPRDDYQCDDN